MSFLTEYFDEYREHPIRYSKMCRPEERYAKIHRKWLDTKIGSSDKECTEEEIDEFIKKTMKSLRGQSTYYNEYCAHLSEEFKTRPFVPRPKKRRCVKKTEAKADDEEAPQPPVEMKLSLKETELMKLAAALYGRDMDKPTLEPLPTHPRLLGYIRPYYYKTATSEYQESIGRLAYELVKDDRLPKYYAHNGGRPRWGVPPDGEMQPELDIIPYEQERLY